MKSTSFVLFLYSQKEGEVSLTVRTLLEMEPYLKKIDEELMDCKICGCLVVKVERLYHLIYLFQLLKILCCLQGIVCPNESCASKVHRFCLSRLSRATSTASSQIKCPKCQRLWPNIEEVLLMPTNNNNNNGSQQPNGRTQRASQSSQRREQSQSQPQPGTSNGAEGTSGGRRRTRRQISSSESESD